MLVLLRILHALWMPCWYNVLVLLNFKRTVDAILDECANYDEILDLNKSISTVADKLGVSEDAGGSGYRLITNAGKDSHQEVPHLHFHLVAGKPLGPLLVE